MILYVYKTTMTARKNMKKYKTVAISGYFDPIHPGHLEYISMAKSLGERLIVIVNNDHQCVLKKGKPFMCEDDRLTIVRALRDVDQVYLSIDTDKSVCKSLDDLRPDVFANGGDRKDHEVPESKICKKHNIQMIDGLGDKIRSSSDLTGLKEIKD